MAASSAWGFFNVKPARARYRLLSFFDRGANKYAASFSAAITASAECASNHHGDVFMGADNLPAVGDPIQLGIPQRVQVSLYRMRQAPQVVGECQVLYLSGYGRILIGRRGKIGAG